jgi:hypothetical protein
VRKRLLENKSPDLNFKRYFSDKKRGFTDQNIGVFANYASILAKTAT